jgi:hypothetical protein
MSAAEWVARLVYSLFPRDRKPAKKSLHTTPVAAGVLQATLVSTPRLVCLLGTNTHLYRTTVQRCHLPNPPIYILPRIFVHWRVSNFETQRISPPLGFLAAPLATARRLMHKKDSLYPSFLFSEKTKSPAGARSQ